MRASVTPGGTDCSSIGMAVRSTSTILDVGSRILCRGLGIEPANPHDRRPCLTSFRHTFAVRCLREWHSAGLHVQSLLPTLAVYLGHVGPESSYWYLSATPNLLRAAGARFSLDRSEGGEG